jgi:hypothetical protein
MYSVDDCDRVSELTDLPQSSVGAPLPMVCATEGALVVAYLVEQFNAAWDGTWVRSVDAQTPGEQVAVVQFRRPYAHQFGPPNDEAFMGHPLAARGLHPYGAFEVRDSSWVREFERRNRVHAYHSPERFWRLRHFILAFHDSTFECVAEDLTVSVVAGSLASVAPEILQRAGIAPPDS